MNVFEINSLPEEIKNSRIFKELFEKNFFIETDLFFCAYHLRNKKNIHSDVFIFLAIVSYFIRKGHICFSLEQQFFPQDYQNIYQNFITGSIHLPEEIKLSLFIIHNEFWYLKGYFEAEKLLINNIVRIYKNTPKLIFNFPINISEKLTKEQVSVLELVSNGSLSLICGGPGTGKTFLAIEFVLLFLKTFPEAIVKILAPTGKVVSNFKEKIPENELLNLSIQTIHAFLEEMKYEETSSADLILVDEGSMIDAPIFSKLFSVIKDYSRIIIIGDPNQLPPIGTGCIFKDLTNTLIQNTFFLKKTLRTDETKITELSKKILAGKIYAYKTLPDFKEMCSYLAKEYYKLVLKTSSQYSLCVLTPLKQGVWGSLHLNKHIYEELKQLDCSSKIPIIITKNLSHLNVWNGDTGYFSKEENCIFLKKKNKKIYLSQNYFSYNYATSIHKSQGSEYDTVHILLPPQTILISKEILYTAVTRAKKNVEIWGDENSIKKSLENSLSRLSGVKYFLRDLIVKNRIK